MTVIPHKVKGNGKEYYELIDVKRVKGKTVQTYVGYLGKNPRSKIDVNPKEILPYLERLLTLGISQEDIDTILKKIGIEYASCISYGILEKTSYRVCIPVSE